MFAMVRRLYNQYCSERSPSQRILRRAQGGERRGSAAAACLLRLCLSLCLGVTRSPSRTASQAGAGAGAHLSSRVPVVMHKEQDSPGSLEVSLQVIMSATSSDLCKWQSWQSGKPRGGARQ